jgi:Ca2+/Na+ antiporter
MLWIMEFLILASVVATGCLLGELQQREWRFGLRSLLIATTLAALIIGLASACLRLW